MGWPVSHPRDTSRGLRLALAKFDNPIETSMKNKMSFPDKTTVHCFRIVLTMVLFQFRAFETQLQPPNPIGSITRPPYLEVYPKFSFARNSSRKNLWLELF
jgi:hypothetical protein